MSTVNQGSLIRPLVTTHSFKETIFNATNNPANDYPTDTGKVTDSMGSSLIRPINVLDASNTLPVPLCETSQLSLPFNVHRIDKTLLIAP